MRKKEEIAFEDLCSEVILAYNDEMRKKKVLDQKKEKSSNTQSQTQTNLRSTYPKTASSFYAEMKRCRKCGSLYHFVSDCLDKDEPDIFSRDKQVRNKMCKDTRKAKDNEAQDDKQQAESSPQNRSQTGRSNQGNGRGSTFGNGNKKSATDPNLNKALRRNEEFNDASFCVLQENERSLDILLDNCSTKHIVNSLNRFTHYQPFEQGQNLTSINGGCALGIGTVKVISLIKGVQFPFNMKNVLYVPSSPVNIFSQLAAQDNGIRFCENESQDYWYSNGYVNKKQLLHYKLRLNFNNDACFIIDVEWHSIFGHQAYQRLDKTSDNVVGMKVDRTDQRENGCETCVLAKARNRSFNHTLLKETKPGIVVHTDICNLPCTSLDGVRYAIIFGCEASRYLRIYF